MDDNVKPLRIHPDKRLRNRLGKLAVPCEVSGRWLRFREAGDKTPFGEMLYVDVMTGDPDSPRKICDLIIRKEDLLTVLGRVRVQGS